MTAELAAQAGPFYDQGGFTLYLGDVCEQLDALPPGIVQAAITSPPYFQLRHYRTSDDPREVGREETVPEFLEHLWQVFDSVHRVLRDDGVLFVNLDDSAAGSGKGPNTKNSHIAGYNGRSGLDANENHSHIPEGDKAKDLMGIPWLFALGMKSRGWYFRDVIPWIKESVTPESVRDRFTDSWEPVFMFTKSRYYYWDWFAAREPAVQAGRVRWDKVGGASRHHAGETPNEAMGSRMTGSSMRNRRNILYPRPDPVDWDYCYPCDQFLQGTGRRHIKTRKRLRPDGSWDGTWERLCPSCLDPMVAHTAAFPRELPRQLLNVSTSERGGCAACGAPYRRVTSRDAKRHNPGAAAERVRATNGAIRGGTEQSTLGATEGVSVQSLGWERSCSCSTENTSPCVVLDPFSGSGTVALVAKEFGLRSIGCELSEPYARASIHRVGSQVQLEPELFTAGPIITQEGLL